MRERRRERKEGGRAGRSGARPGDGSGTEIPRIPRDSARGPAANPPRQRDLRPRIPPDETPFPPSRFLRGRPSRERERFARCACAVDGYSPLEECMAALAFCSLDFCSFGGMVSSSYARSTARADCLWTASLTPGPPSFWWRRAGNSGDFSEYESLVGPDFSSRRGSKSSANSSLHRNRARATSQNPAAAKGPPREGRGRVEIPCCERKKKFRPPPPLQEGPSQGRASEGRARGKQTRVKPARNLPEPKDNMGHKNVWNSHPRKYGLGSHPW